MKQIKIICAALAVLLTLSGCNIGLVRIEHDIKTPLYTDAASGISYTYAPSCYEAVRVGDKYAKWKNESTTVLFYDMEGADPTLWLTEEGKTVFYSQDVELPSPEEMGISEILVCAEDEYAVALVSISDAQHMSEIISTWQNGEAVEYTAATPVRNYRVKMVSELYPWMYFNLIYVEYSDGTSYLYCRDLDRCVAAGDLIKGYLDGTLG